MLSRSAPGEDAYERYLRLSELIGRVEVGVADIDIAAPRVAPSEVGVDDVCVICMEELVDCARCRRTRCDACYTKY